MPSPLEKPHPLNDERKFDLVVGSVRDYAIFLLDAQGRVQTWNLGARTIKGFAPDEIIGQTIDRFYTPEDRAAGLPHHLLSLARIEGRAENAGWRVRKDGTRFFADVVITALNDENGELIGYVKVTRDLTERREADLERLRLAQAQEAIRMRDDFLSIASHELRTPLMALQLQIESLQRMFASQDPKLESKLERAERSIHRLTDLVDALLDVTRITSGKLSIHPERADLAEIVSDVLDRMQESVAQSGCHLTTSVERGLVGDWDPLRMGQVVTNLLSNALKYAAGSAVELGLRRDSDTIKLHVCDGGPGIPSADLDRVFGRFERASDKRHHGGLGLGLYVAREIVVAHRGSIRVENRATGGAMFAIELPANGLGT